jgi:hypothetical protein
MSGKMIDEFDAWVKSLGLRYFQPHELRFLGNSHYTKGRAHGKNTLPPKSIWNAMVPTIRAADEARERLGSGIIILSAYRSPAYNSAIGGAKWSRHMANDALDLAPTRATVAALRKVLMDVRAEGKFQGGIGRYPNFIHIDNRGANVNF